VDIFFCDLNPLIVVNHKSIHFGFMSHILSGLQFTEVAQKSFSLSCKKGKEEAFYCGQKIVERVKDNEIIGKVAQRCKVMTYCHNGFVQDAWGEHYCYCCLHVDNS